MMFMFFIESMFVCCGYLVVGFIFIDGCFVCEVVNDFDIFFLGEEIVMVVCVFIYGYDCYVLYKILLWYFYICSKYSKVWFDYNNEVKKFGVVKLVWWEWDKIVKSWVCIFMGIE